MAEFERNIPDLELTTYRNAVERQERDNVTVLVPTEGLYPQWVQEVNDGVSDEFSGLIKVGLAVMTAAIDDMKDTIPVPDNISLFDPNGDGIHINPAIFDATRKGDYDLNHVMMCGADTIALARGVSKLIDKPEVKRKSIDDGPARSASLVTFDFPSEWYGSKELQSIAILHSHPTRPDGINGTLQISFGYDDPSTPPTYSKYLTLYYGDRDNGKKAKITLDHGFMKQGRFPIHGHGSILAGQAFSKELASAVTR